MISSSVRRVLLGSFLGLLVGCGEADQTTPDLPTNAPVQPPLSPEQSKKATEVGGGSSAAADPNPGAAR